MYPNAIRRSSPGNKTLPASETTIGTFLGAAALGSSAIRVDRHVAENRGGLCVVGPRAQIEQRDFTAQQQRQRTCEGGLTERTGTVRMRIAIGLAVTSQPPRKRLLSTGALMAESLGICLGGGRC